MRKEERQSGTLERQTRRKTAKEKKDRNLEENQIDRYKDGRKSQEKNIPQGRNWEPKARGRCWTWKQMLTHLFDVLSPFLRPELQAFGVFLFDGNPFLNHGDQILGQAKSILGALDRAFVLANFPEGVRRRLNRFLTGHRHRAGHATTMVVITRLIRGGESWGISDRGWWATGLPEDDVWHREEWRGARGLVCFY